MNYKNFIFCCCCCTLHFYLFAALYLKRIESEGNFVEELGSSIYKAYRRTGSHQILNHNGTPRVYEPLL